MRNPSETYEAPKPSEIARESADQRKQELFEKGINIKPENTTEFKISVVELDPEELKPELTKWLESEIEFSKQEKAEEIENYHMGEKQEARIMKLELAFAGLEGKSDVGLEKLSQFLLEEADKSLGATEEDVNFKRYELVMPQSRADFREAQGALLSNLADWAISKKN